MHIDLTIKNYRCFSDEHPVHISIRPGFTAFVGVNNTGKSSLLKFFYEFRALFGAVHRGPSNLISMLKGVVDPNYHPTVPDQDSVFSDWNLRNLQIEFGFTFDSTDSPLSAPRPKRILLEFARVSKAWTAMCDFGDGFDYLSDDYNGIQDGVLLVKGAPAIDISAFQAVCGDFARSLYIGPFRNAINLASSERYYDIHVGQAVIQAWRDMKTGVGRQQNKKAYDLIESIRLIFGFEQLDINATPNDQALQLFVNGRSYALSEMGAGLTQFFLVLFNAAQQAPSYILIDEPELNLHPSLQLDFLTTLGSYASRGVIFATHNYGLARASANQVYLVRRPSTSAPSEVSLSEETPRLSEFLGEVGFSAYRDLGYDKVLLVEGPTDVTTIQQFLRVYGKDHQIVVLSLGGRSGIRRDAELQLEELKRISPNVFALIDSERAIADAPLEPVRQDFVTACQNAGVQCHVMDNRAIENYFPDHAVTQVIGNQYHALTPFEQFAAPNKWDKALNWRIGREMTVAELDATDIGQFLKTL